LLLLKVDHPLDSLQGSATSVSNKATWLRTVLIRMANLQEAIMERGEAPNDKGKEDKLCK